MPRLSVEKFSGGMDRRRGLTVSPADRVYLMRNAYVTTGGAIVKRPGLILVDTLEAGTVELFGAFGQLHTFYGQGAISHANALFSAHKVAHSSAMVDVTKVHFFDVFNGAIYVSVEYSDESTLHHYLEGGTPTYIQDVNCPHSTAVAKAAQKLWASAGTQVRFSATSNARDWTTVDDAGFLPTDQQSSGSKSITAIGVYRGQLVPFTASDAQIWTVDPDPQNHAYQETVPNAGTCYPRSIAGVGGDLYFLGDWGFRSIALLALTQNLTDVDVGSPVDALVRADIVSGPGQPRALFAGRWGQYWCTLAGRVWVFSYSRTAKLAAWSYYDFPFTVDALTENDGDIYIRSGNNVYRVDDATSTDDGDAYEVEVEAHFSDAKKPAIEKQWTGFDVEMEGEAYIEYLYNARDRDERTHPFPIDGFSAAGGMLPVELVSVDIAPRFSVVNDQPWKLDGYTFHYEELGAL